VAAAAKFAKDGTIEAARIALGAVASRPFLVPKAGEALVGRKLTDELIAEVAATVGSRAKPLDNADMDIYWRKQVTPDFVGYALRELRGDDMRAMRMRIARQAVG
jgi:CO/xanthine dehydrogenase FAD-binding subunit